jgi:hypothetical protein
VAIWYILWLFVIFFPVLVSSTKKNLATLFGSIAQNHQGSSALKFFRRETSFPVPLQFNYFQSSVWARVARFFSVQYTKTWKNITNSSKVEQQATKHTK